MGAFRLSRRVALPLHPFDAPNDLFYFYLTSLQWLGASASKASQCAKSDRGGRYVGCAQSLRSGFFVCRYLSDSAYWLYLAHVPLVIFAQSFIAQWDQPLALKATLILVAIASFLLLTYEYLVRYTFLGTLLNGPRTRD